MIDWLLTPNGGFSIRSSAVQLHNAEPIVNGLRLSGGVITVLQHDPPVLRFTSTGLPGVTAQIEMKRTDLGIALRMAITEKPEVMPLNSFGIRFSGVEGLYQYLRSGYHSWDGSYYVQPGSLPDAYSHPAEMETGYGFTQILTSDRTANLLIGFDRHDHFQQTFSFDTGADPVALTILTHWDQKQSPLEGIYSEWLHVFESDDVEGGLRQWANLVAANATPPPRAQGPLITGWCSWYNLYAAITEENILDYLQGAAQAAAKHQLPRQVFQIDDGFTPEMGDWLEVKPQFPRSMKPVLDEIRAAGFIPGLWIAPFLVGNRSHLCQEHPDWLVKDRLTGGPLVLMRFYGEFRWHKRSEEYYLLDVTHPKAFAYLREVFRTWREDWGCEYFKTDFMFYGAKDGPETAVYHQPGLTRVEIWRKAAQMIRETIGDALWMGCGCPLWASVGLVDAVRIGRDVGVQWKGGQSAQSLLRDQATRNFGNHILWQADPDSVLLREQFHLLTDAEVEALAIYAGMAGGVMTTSDHLGQLSERRLRLWRLILPQDKTPCRYPLLGKAELTYSADPALPNALVTRSSNALAAQTRPVPGGSAVFLLNTGEEAIDDCYPFRDLGLPEAGYLWVYGAEQGSDQPVTSLAVHLQPHAGLLAWLTDQPLTSQPVSIGWAGE